MFGFNLARGDELVVVGHNIDEFKSGDIIGFEFERIDDHLEHLIAVPCELRFEHVLHGLEAVLHLFGVMHEGAFGHWARQVDDQHREF